MTTKIVSIDIKNEHLGARFSKMPKVSVEDKVANEALLESDRLAVQEPERRASLFDIKISGLGPVWIIRDLTACTTVATLKELIKDEEGIAVDEQRLAFAGKQLDNEMTLGSKMIGKDSMIHVVLRLRGGNK